MMMSVRLQNWRLKYWRLRIQAIRVAVVAFVIGLAGTLGLLAARDRLTPKIAVTLIAGVGAFYVLLQGKRSYWALFCIGIASITLGHRGIYTDSKTYLVALQVIDVALFLVLLLQNITSGQPLNIALPISLTFITIWAVLHAAVMIVTLPSGVGAQDSVMLWAVTFATGFPAFYVVGKLVTQEQQVIRILKILMVVSAVMSVLGIIEYAFPSLTRFFPGIFTQASFTAQDGFQRAEFSFWGYPAAASIISWGLFVAFDQFSNTKSFISGLFALGILVVDGIAVFISGQRSSWIAVAVGLVILNLNLKMRTLIMTAVLLVMLVLILPPEFWKRINTLVSVAVYGQVIDTSTQSRLNRWQLGFDNILSSPLTGVGYEGQLVHDSVLEIGSRIGVIPAIVFLIFLVQEVVRIFRCYRLPSPTAKRYGLIFIALCVPWLIQMAIETDLQVQPFAAAQWTFLAVGWYLVDVFRPRSITESAVSNAAPNLSAPAFATSDSSSASDVPVLPEILPDAPDYRSAADVQL